MAIRSKTLVAAAFALAALDAPAQAPDATPLYVVTYVEARPDARDDAAAILKAYRDASRKTQGNLRALVVQRTRRPGQFVLLTVWRDKAAWDAGMEGAKGFREKLHAIRNAPTDDRFHNRLSVGPMDLPASAGALYGVTHVDVIPPQKDNAIAALQLLGEANRAAAGNLRYEIVQQTNRPNHFTVVELWRSRADYEANSMSPQQREFRDKLSQMAGALYDERLYEILE
jgi:quinol monooxygenase YgiN